MSVATQTINGKQALVYLPSNYDKTKAYPCLVFLPGLGETGSAGTSKLLVHGPFLYLNGSTDLGLDLIVIAIEPDEAFGMDSSGKEAAADLAAIESLYSVSGFGLTGLSMGCQEWMNFFWQPGQDLSKVSALFMFSADPPNLAPSNGTAVKNYSLFASLPIFYYGGCGSADAMYGMQYPDYQAIAAIKPKIAPAWDTWQGVGHGDPVWSDGYNPARKSPSMGMSIYAKMVALATAAAAPAPVTPTPTPTPAAAPKTIKSILITYSDGSTASLP